MNSVVVDEEGILRVRGAKDSDHNTICLSIDFKQERKTTKITTWKKANRETWKTFNNIVKSKLKNENRIDYKILERHILNTLYKVIGKRTIRIGKDDRIDTPAIKKKRFERN